MVKLQAHKANEVAKTKRQAALKASRKVAKTHKKGSQAWIASFHNANAEAICKAKQEDADFIAQGLEIKQDEVAVAEE